MKSMILVAFSLLLSSNAFGWLKICNRTNSHFYVAIATETSRTCTADLTHGGYCYDTNTRRSIVEGWWGINANSCSKISNVDMKFLSFQQFYLRVERNGQFILPRSGSLQYICTDPSKRFSFLGSERAMGRVVENRGTHPVLGRCSRITGGRNNSGKRPLLYKTIHSGDYNNFTYTIR